MSTIIEDTLATKTLQDLTRTIPTRQRTNPRLTKKKINETIQLLKNVEISGGLLKIARQVGLTRDQVTQIQAKMQSRIAELQAN